jgi:hypothetical protein
MPNLKSSLLKSSSSNASPWRATLFLALALSWLAPKSASAQLTPATATVTITDDGTGSELAPRFMGLSYESSILLPTNGKYYFDPHDRALVNTFRTLGINSLRLGGYMVDNPKAAVPQEKDIDSLFEFARAAGVKVIYSFRLHNGDPAVSARLASYIAAHDADALDCFAIGNEPNGYDKTFDVYFADLKSHYDAILKEVPNAMFDGPSVYGASKNLFPEKLADAMVPQGHMAMISDHFYVMGSGRPAEKDLVGNRARFLSNEPDERFAKTFAEVGSKLMAKGIPYRVDELNNCSIGGAKGISDTYTASLWALDATHWWAARHVLGLNYHTGERIAVDGSVTAQNYSAFLHRSDGEGLEIRPASYGYLAFKESASGRPLETVVKTTSPKHFTAYSYRADDGSIYVTLINKTFGDKAEPISVALQLPKGVGTGGAERMDLMQKHNDIAAQTEITLGGAPIDAQGVWTGHWEAVERNSSRDQIMQVAPTSATIVHLPAVH